MPSGARVAILVGYFIFAVAVPAWVVLFPGQSPLTLNEEVLRLEGKQFATPRQALGEGAESYQMDVLNDQPQRLAGIAADYPDGSNAVIARFDSEAFAEQAASALIEMIPHQALEQDLWSRHFHSESGEFVLLARVGAVVVLIISDREAVAKGRLEALPALHYNANPGVGAVLARQPVPIVLAVAVLYLLFQYVTLVRLASWANTRLPKTGVAALAAPELKEALIRLNEAQAPGVQVQEQGKELVCLWRPAAAEGREGNRRVRLKMDEKRHAVLALLESSAPAAGEGPWRIERRILWRGLGDESSQKDPGVALLTALADSINGAGWGVRPVVSFVPLLSG